MGRVTQVRGCRLRTFERRWDWPERHRSAVDAHWDTARRANAGYFDGEVFSLGPWRIADGVLEGELQPTRFREYIYWRSQGYPADAGAYEGFGSALILSAEGHVILGRQRAGNVNGGLAYLPGGFIDRNDIEANGEVDIDQSVARETAEETGLGPAELERVAGYCIIETGVQVSIVCTFRSHLTAGDLVRRIGRHVAAQPKSELTEAVVITGGDYDRSDVPAYTQVLLDWLYRPR